MVEQAVLVAQRHSQGLTVALRCIAYAMIMLMSHAISAAWFWDADVANVSLFLVFATSFELFSHRLVSWTRVAWLTVCIVGMLAAGVLLVHQASVIHASSQVVHRQ